MNDLQPASYSGNIPGGGRLFVWRRKSGEVQTRDGRHLYHNQESPHVYPKRPSNRQSRLCSNNSSSAFVPGVGSSKQPQGTDHPKQGF
jgi:hypothetical protein